MKVLYVFLGNRGDKLMFILYVEFIINVILLILEMWRDVLNSGGIFVILIKLL